MASEYSHARGVSPINYSHDAVLEEISRQCMLASSRRMSRGSSGQQQQQQQRLGSTTSMRVMKPRSANNSPRSAFVQQRRRPQLPQDTLGMQQQQQQKQQQTAYSGMPFNNNQLPTPNFDSPGATYMEPTRRGSRPMSWHPTSHLPQTTTTSYLQPGMPYSSFPVVYTHADMHAAAQQLQQFPPTPAVYSGYNSPAAFSPAALPPAYYDTTHYFSPSWAAPLLPAPAISSPHLSPTSSMGQCQSLPTDWGYAHPAEHAAANWTSYGAVPELCQSSTPPTPDMSSIDAGPHAFPSEEVLLPFAPLQEDVDDDEGEILVGMGLYSPPEKCPTTTDHHTLETYRNSVAHLLGSAYKYPEPTGKGLKLEDAWEPPESLEEDEDDDDQEEENEEDTRDAEGEDIDES